MKWFQPRNEILKNSLAILAVLVISIVGVKLLTISQATTGATMSLASNSTTLQPNTPLSLTLRLDTGGDPVNSVQASMNYDASKLRFVSMSEGVAFDQAPATDTSTPGVIRIARATGTPVTGVNDVVILNFTVLASSGTVDLTFDKNFSFVVNSSTNSDILATAPAATYAVGTVPVSQPTMTLTPGTGTYPTGTDISVEVKVTGSQKLTTAEVGLNYPASQLQFISVTEGSAFPTKQRTSTGTPGTIDIIRAISGGNPGVAGTHTIVTLNFKVIGTSGPFSITYSNAAALYDDSGSGMNILDRAGSTGTTYNVEAASACANAPSTPGTPVGTNTGYTTVALSWAASTPGSGCTLSGYRVIRNGAVVATVTNGMAYTDNGLGTATPYTYKIEAFDTAGRSSSQSGSTTVTTKADDQAPSTPTALSASAPNAATINITWGGSTDFPNPGGSGVTGYRIYRNNATTPTYTVTNGLSYSDTNAQSDTTYSYYVTAYDAKGNESAPSSIVSAKTAPVVATCTLNPTVPGGLNAGTSSMTSTTLSWQPSAAGTGCALSGYRVFRGNVLIGSPTQTTFTDTGLAPNTSYNYTVQAFDSNNHNSALSTVKMISTTADTAAPAAPLNVAAAATSSFKVDLSWGTSTDNVAVTAYRVYRGGTLLITIPATYYSDTTVTDNTDYSYAVSAIDAAGNESPKVRTTPLVVHTPANPDTGVPTAPGNLRALTVGTGSVVIAWDASTDNKGIAGYHVYRGGVFMQDSPDLTYTDLTLDDNTDYVYIVKAFDAAGNTSAASNTAAVSTLQLSDVVLGDLNGDETIDLRDLSRMLSHWRQVNVPPEYGDIDLNGTIDIYDLSALISHLGDDV